MVDVSDELEKVESPTEVVTEDPLKRVTCSDYLRSGEISQLAQYMAETAEEFVRNVWLRGWQVVHHRKLPNWLKDNEFLVRYHRPQLNTFWGCFKSIFRVHTETGNIWTHLLGCGSFLTILIFMMAQVGALFQWQDKLVFLAFFIGAVFCLGFSCLFHTLSCHSETIGLLFNRLDYAGIAFLTIGSFIPYLYYSFYCTLWAKIFYTCLISILGTLAIVVSMHKSFITPRYRGLRAGVFIALGLSGVIPCLHTICLQGFWFAVENYSLGWLALMAFLYISGATIYAVRIPERLFPGRFDIWLLCLLKENADYYAQRFWFTRLGSKLFRADLLPGWMKDNEYLIRHHRPQLQSFVACLTSAFELHSETVNIWSHLLGFACFFAICCSILLQPSALIQWPEKLMFGLFHVGAMCCLGFSCSFHMTMCHSNRVRTILNKLDYCGIVLIIIGSFIPYVHYLFYCDRLVRLVYTGCISLLGLLTLTLSLVDQFRSPASRKWRALTFTLLGLVALLPCLHSIARYGLAHSVTNLAVGWFMLMGLTYLLGAFLYASRLPERLCPGRFDIWVIVMMMATLFSFHNYLS